MTTPNFERIRVNVVQKPRFAVMEGRDYIVLPVVPLVEGVHPGSHGPILYTLEDMSRYATAWNHKPIVVNHPKKDGEFVSADDPTILSVSKVGLMMANSIIDTKQHAEAWLEKERLKAVDERILDMIDDGLIVEVSVGLFTDNEETEGEWNGQEYMGIARNYRPDHLALLPDLVGACSVKKGCGLFTAAEAMPIGVMQRLQNSCNGILDNEASHGEVYSKLYDIICAPQNQRPYYYIQEVFDDYVIYGDDSTYYKQEYKVSNDKVELVGKPKSVKREIIYNQSGGKDMAAKTDCGCKKEIKDIVDNLISNGKNWSEDDREYLEKQEEPMLKKFQAMEGEGSADPPKPKAKPKAAAKVVNEEEEEEEDSTPAPTPTPKKKVAAMSEEEWLRRTPANLRKVFASGLAAHKNEEKRLKDIIISNEENEFTEDELNVMEFPMLQKLAALACKQEEESDAGKPIDLFNYVANAGAPQTNSSTQEEALPLPVMNFGKKE